VDFVDIDALPERLWPRGCRVEDKPCVSVRSGQAPQLQRIGIGHQPYVMNDNAEPDFLEFVRDPVNGFLCMTLPLKGDTELCAKVA
jgi:hypothetical protein